MSFTFHRASRKRQKLRLAIYGVSGSGKTMSALRLAKGIAGPDGRIAVIDTEHGSAELYSDRFEFDALQLTQDKSVDAYIQAMNAAVQGGYDVLVVDSISHAWREILELVDASSKTGNKFLGWSKATPKQKLFIEFILAAPIHIIATMRADTAWEVETNDRGKKEPKKIGLKPEQGKGIEFEFTMLALVNEDHSAVFKKDRSGAFQDRTIDLLTEEVGEEILRWLNEGSGEQALPQATQPRSQSNSLDDLRSSMGGSASTDEINAYLKELVACNRIAGVETTEDRLLTKINADARRERRDPIELARERVERAREATKELVHESES